MVEFPVSSVVVPLVIPEGEEGEEDWLPVLLLHPPLNVNPAVATAWETLRVATEVVEEVTVARPISTDVEV